MNIEERTSLFHDFNRLEARERAIDDAKESLEKISYQVKNIITGNKIFQQIYEQEFDYLWDATDQYPFNIGNLKSDLERMIKAIRSKYDF